jgi:hypothetical protein
MSASHPAGVRTVVCQCDCGEEVTVTLNNLTRGATSSCGCRRNELIAALHRGQKHGLRHHELYRTWVSMRQRCNNPNNPGYIHYGGRGIEVCARWSQLAVFISDVEAEIGSRPSGMTLDRKNNDGNYEPGNVQWATDLEQVRNRRSVAVLAARIIELEAEVESLRSQLAISPAG